uniref:Putative structural protein n=1 Tax=Cecropis daurica parvoviridae sp. TaxID=2794470 RepID=A0A8E7L4S1_9VIRU|nr:MAG: putative structural protein [Cecropis daurica parvoviridae sp.]
MDVNFFNNNSFLPPNPPENPYDNSGITWYKHGFMGPGNKVVDKNNKANFKQLPDKCTDWAALEHDVAYHNISLNREPNIHEVATLDNQAIDNVRKECSADSPYSSKVLEVGLLTKQHIEELAEAAVYPFGSNKALYPRENTNGQPIDWFTKGKNRRKDLSSKHAFSLFRAASPA